jgi:hypothetical protein
MSRLDDRLTDELRKVLRRQEPPTGFEERVLARVSLQSKRETGLAGWFRLPAMRLPLMARWAATAALCLVVAAGVHYENERQERIQGEAAKVKLMQALRVAGTELQAVREKVMESSGNRTAEQ